MSMETKEEATSRNDASKPGLFSRQPFSTLEKIAFWAAIVLTLAGLGGVITLTITSGSPSADSVTGLACALAIVLILASRMRWAPLVTTVIGAYELYLVGTEPYALASLADPKGPDGGFGKFVGIVIVLACVLLVLGCSIGATVQNYRHSSRKAPRVLPAALGMVAGLVVGAVFIGALSQPPAPVGTSYTNGVPTVHMNATQFDQSSVRISKGSKLMLIDDTSVVHILANGTWQNGKVQKLQEVGAPLVNNVQLNGNSVEIGPFNMAGTYHIYCEVHVGMNLIVIVQ
jgi:plastocyanin